MIYYVIPARKGSNGFPGKNRILFSATAETVETVKSQVIVSTDDDVIIDMARERGFTVIIRPDELATDDASTRDVLIHASSGMRPDDIIVMLYLTYPNRTKNDIDIGIAYFDANFASSMLCSMEPITNPFLCMYDMGLHGAQIIVHDLCRRQEYPKVFEISHFLFISRVEELKHLNRNLYNIDTVFMPIERTVDVDYEKDLLKL